MHLLKVLNFISILILLFLLLVSGSQVLKSLLKRTIEDQALMYGELSILMCRVEAVLNSRPRTPLTMNPVEIKVLTPGHFLIGTPLVCPPELSYLDLKVLIFFFIRRICLLFIQF